MLQLPASGFSSAAAFPAVDGAEQMGVLAGSFWQKELGANKTSSECVRGACALPARRTKAGIWEAELAERLFAAQSFPAAGARQAW